MREGRDLLWALYQSNEEDLHLSVPSLSFPCHSVTLTGLVGIGSSAIVYSADVGAKGLMAVKHFKSEYRDRLETESKNHHIVKQYVLPLSLFSCIFHFLLSSAFKIVLV